MDKIKECITFIIKSTVDMLKNKSNKKKKYQNYLIEKESELNGYIFNSCERWTNGGNNIC